jgi:hypothetical protein
MADAKTPVAKANRLRSDLKLDVSADHPSDRFRV